MSARLTFRPLTPARWPDVETLFGRSGACSGCWCMWWRRTRAEWQREGNGGNRRAFRGLVQSGVVPGVLAYRGREVAGWCAVEPRDAYPVLARSPVLKPVDDAPVWSVTCFFVKRGFREQGIGEALLSAAVAHARRRGARTVEGYPKDRAPGRDPVSIFTGLTRTFLALGFREVARRSPNRPILRLDLR